MATFVAMFYSQRSREIILKVSKRWNTDNIFTLLKRVLNDYYLGDKIEYMKFKDDTFVNILTELHKVNKTIFTYNPDKNKGGNPLFYIGRLYNLLNIDYTMFEYNIENDSLVYSLLNEEFNNFIYIKNSHSTKFYAYIKYKYLFLKYTNQINFDKMFKKKPSILIVSTENISDIFDNLTFYGIKGKNIYNNEINDSNIKKNIQSMDDIINYNDSLYHLDSVILSNWNKMVLNNDHAIAGITCKENKFVYNGWTRTSMDPSIIDNEITRNIPCELMPYDWNVKNHGDFCLNTKTCIPDIMKIEGEEYNKKLCFNFNKGNRILVYVKMHVDMRSSIRPTTQIHKSYQVSS